MDSPRKLFEGNRSTSKIFKFSHLFSALALVLTASLAACGGGSSGVSGGSTSTSSNNTGTGGNPAIGTSSSDNLYTNMSSFTLSGSTLSNTTSIIQFWSGMSNSSPSTLFSDNSHYYPWMVPDTNGNLWAIQDTFPTSINNNSPTPSTAIVKLSGAGTNPSSLTATVVYTLPSNVNVHSLVFDSSGNLYFDQEDTGDSTGKIMKISSASTGGTTATTFVIYDSSAVSNNTDNAMLAFDGVGNLWAYESGNGVTEGIYEYPVSGGVLSTTPTQVISSSSLPSNSNSGNGMILAFDSTGNLWGMVSPCFGGTSCSSGTLVKWAAGSISGTPTPVISSVISASSGQINQIVFDSNGNLWFSALVGSPGSSVSHIYELPSSSSALTDFKDYGDNNYPGGVAIDPAPSNLPIH